MGTPDDGLFVLSESAPAENRLDRLTESVQDLRPALVVVDTAIRFINAEDGNDYAKMVRALAPFTELAHSTETHVMLVHHSRKSGGQHGHESLGSAGILGAVDVYISLRRDPKSGVRSAYGEGRDGVKLREVILELDEEGGWVSAAGDLKQARVQDKGREIHDFLQDRESPATRTDIIEGVRGAPNTISAALGRLVDGGQIERSGEGKRGSPFRYSIFPLKGKVQNTETAAMAAEGAR